MTVINGYTRTCGLIGNPVEHTLSPVIHNNLADITGDNLVYTAFHVQTGFLKEAISGAYALNLLGMNVTVPYKSDVIPFLKDIDPLAKNIGAVNTLVRVEGGYKGYNTDMPGLYRAMCSDGVDIKDRTVLILGAGGVARAVAMLLSQKGAKRVVILNRTLEKAEKVVSEINAISGDGFACAMELSRYNDLPGDEKYIAIQATSVGMHPNDEDVVIDDAEFYKKVEVGYDLIFNPENTKFMKLVSGNGGRAYNGAKMLLYQGIIAYELWTGKNIDDGTAEIIYSKMMGRS